MSRPETGSLADGFASGEAFNPFKAMGVWMQAVAPFGILITDAELRIKSWNDWLVVHSGIPALNVIGKQLAETYPNLDARRLAGYYARALAGEIVVLSAALHKHLLPLPATVPAGGFSTMLQTVRIAPLSEDGQIVGTITVIEDVTQREAQANLLQRQQEIDRLLSASLAVLLQSHDPAAEMGGIFSTIAPVVAVDTHLSYLVQPGGTFLELRASAGISPKQRHSIAILGLSESDQRALRVRAEPAARSVAGLAETLHRFGIREQLLFPLTVGDRVLGLAVFGTYGQKAVPAADVAVLERLTRYVAIALDRALRERETIAASRAKDDFLAALSHELRTPLNPVLLVSSDAASNAEYSPEVREAFHVIEKNALLEARLIDDLLDITRIEHGKFNLESKPLDVHAVLRDALENVRPDAAENRLSVQVNLRAGSSSVLGDPGRLQQVFWNVLKNAVKFTPAGGELWIGTENDDLRGEIVIKIADTGIGMDEGELGRIFGAFSQGDHAGMGRTHRFGGLGLGLAISRKLVESHQGRIEATSRGKQQGSTFVIHLPTAGGPRPKQPVSGAGPAGAAADPAQSGSQPKFRILLVEDHEPSRAILAKLLERRGYEVIAVGSATAALQAASAAPFDLVLSDLGLPDGDGATLMRRLRSEHGIAGIALTGYGQDEAIARSGEAGFLAHLTKPVSAEALDRALSAALRARRN